MPIKIVFKESFWVCFLILTGLALICARIEFGLLPVRIQAELPDGISWISASQAHSGDILWVDARAEDAYKKAHIPGAINVTLKEYNNTFGRFADEWRPNRTVVVYCDGGECQLSAEVAQRLKSSVPEAQIKVLKGGYPAWLAR